MCFVFWLYFFIFNFLFFKSNFISLLVMEQTLSPPLRDRFESAVKQFTNISKDIDDGLKAHHEKEKRW